MEIIDITAAVGPNMVHWPGTEAPSRRLLSSTEQGDPNTVSEWTINAHTGTHMDARNHFIPDGWSMEELDLGRSVGQCRVVDLTGVGGHVTRADLEEARISGQTRVLLKTRNSSGLMQEEAFDEGYTAISAEAAAYLVEIGVETVGVDYLSVEPFEDEEFHTHHTLLGEGDVVILEGLLLGHVEPGDYLLVCLPLKLVGSDGSPARAVLIQE